MTVEELEARYATPAALLLREARLQMERGEDATKTLAAAVRAWDDEIVAKFIAGRRAPSARRG